MLAAGVTLSAPHLRDLCEHTSIILETLAPREISLTQRSEPVLIYTDGAFDSPDATWGAIVIDVVTGTRWCFGGAVPEYLLNAWKHMVGEQFICQIEMYAVLCIRWRMRELLWKRRLILFIDNEPCRFALVKGRSPSDPLFRMSHACASIEAARPAFTWYERISSYSNPADLPSRRRGHEACQRWALEWMGDIVLPTALLVALVDGIEFPRIQSDNQDLKWVMKQQGRDTDDSKDMTKKVEAPKEGQTDKS
eukprot:s993_g3.t1